MFRFSKSHAINFAKLHNLAENLINDIPFVKRRRQRRRLFKIFRIMSYSILIIFLLIIIFLSANILTINQIYDSARSGENNLERSFVQIGAQNYKSSQIYSALAGDNFDSAAKMLNQFEASFLTVHWPWLKQQTYNADYLLAGGNTLSQTLRQVAALGQEINDLINNGGSSALAGLNKDQTATLLNKIYEARPELSGLKANLDLAVANLDQVESAKLSWLLKSKFASLKNQLVQSQELLTNVLPVAQLLPTLLGYPEPSSYLLVVQNPDRIKPSGGFIGTYGILKLAEGDISDLSTYSTTELDKAVIDKTNIKQPDFLRDYLPSDIWSMEDANWSPDWPTAAVRIEWFLRTENSLLAKPENIGKFDGVIAITPKFMTDLLKITGPVEISGKIYDQTNFNELLKLNSSSTGSYDQRDSEIIAEIIKALKIKIFDLPLSEWKQIFNLIDNEILEKNLMIYLADTSAQDIVRQVGLAGEVKNYDDDYLMSVDANLTGAVADSSINRSIDYGLQQSNGGLFAKLRLTYIYHAGADEKAADYETYNRIYLPLGSELIKVTGIDVNDVRIANELSKTSFGTYLKIRPGEILNLTYEYKLPDDIANRIKLDDYNLFIQKQPGSEIKQLAVDFNFIYPVKSYNPASLYLQKISQSELRWQGDLEIDREFKVNF